MGITNLLPFVKNACRPGNIRELEGQTVAVDISCLLHKGLFGCVQQAAEGLNPKNYITYVQRRVEALLNLNCYVILVFDGAPLPAKKGVNDQRRENRMENMRVGTFLLSQGKKNEAVGRLQKAVSLTRDVIEETLEVFRKISRVDVIVAPYEADAQLAFLLENNLADVVITEDSDLIVFGCSKIVFKWDFESESCSIYQKSLLPNCFTGEMNRNFDFIKFRRICILSGCDYLQNGLPGVGLSKSYNFFTKTSQTQLEKILPRIPSYLKMPKLVVTSSFVQDFIKAELTFLHQIVFDPRQRKQRPLSSYGNETCENLHFAGSIAEDFDAVRHSLGNIISESADNDKFKLPEVIPSWSVWTSQSSKNNESEEKPVSCCF
ncbi:unnamed protein product [Auanema sp. JU1783]|nr:unnamed protein product [Auanema sp. JU1783]